MNLVELFELYEAAAREYYKNVVLMESPSRTTSFQLMQRARVLLVKELEQCDARATESASPVSPDKPVQDSAGGGGSWGGRGQGQETFSWPVGPITKPIPIWRFHL